MKIEEKGVVQEFLDVERNLRATDRAIVGEADFNWNIQDHVVVRVGVEGNGDGEKSCGVEEEVRLREVLKSGNAGRRLNGRRLGDGNMFDRLAVARFVTHVGGDKAGIRKTVANGEDGEKPGGAVQEVMRGDRVGDRVGARPGAGWRSGCAVQDFAALPGRQCEIHATGIAGDCL